LQGRQKLTVAADVEAEERRQQARAPVIAMLQDMARTGTQPIVKLEQNPI
jgi:hypothetical protein